MTLPCPANLAGAQGEKGAMGNTLLRIPYGKIAREFDNR